MLIYRFCEIRRGLILGNFAQVLLALVKGGEGGVIKRVPTPGSPPF